MSANMKRSNKLVNHETLTVEGEYPFATVCAYGGLPFTVVRFYGYGVPDQLVRVKGKRMGELHRILTGQGYVVDFDYNGISRRYSNIENIENVGWVRQGGKKTTISPQQMAMNI